MSNKFELSMSDIEACGDKQQLMLWLEGIKTLRKSAIASADELYIQSLQFL